MNYTIDTENKILTINSQSNIKEFNEMIDSLIKANIIDDSWNITGYISIATTPYYTYYQSIPCVCEKSTGGICSCTPTVTSTIDNCKLK